MHLFNVRGLTLLAAGAVLVTGAVLAVAGGTQLGKQGGHVAPPRVATPTGEVVTAYGFDAITGSDTAQVLITDGFGYNWCLTTSIVGPGQWTAVGSVVVAGCPNPNWIASAVITQVSGPNFNVVLQAENPTPDNCATCTSCFVYSGTWHRTTNQGSGSWQSYCASGCTSPLGSGTWSAVSIPGGC